MFGSSFFFGFALNEIVNQIIGLLNNQLIASLIVGSIAFAWAKVLIHFVRSVGRGSGGSEDPSNHEIFPGSVPSPDVAVRKSIHRHERRQYTKRTGNHIHMNSPF